MTTRRVWVTGGGSGVGAATAMALAAAGHEVVISGRREAKVAEVVAGITAAGGRATSLPLDVTDAAALDAAARDHLGGIDVLVAAAGLNTRRRHWSDLDLPAFDAILATNLTALAHCVHAVLPGMRERRDGQLVVVSSRAAIDRSPGAGAAYRASKTGAGQLVESLNDDLHAEGVRATHLCPGDIATDFLDARPNAPDAQARASMLTPDDVARVVAFVVGSPAGVRIDEVVLSPSAHG